MKKRMNKKGFTLAELLIVVAIIAVLVAVSIPVFTSQLAKARLATNQANARAAKAAAIAAYLEDDTVRSITYTTSTGANTKATATEISEKSISSDDIADWDTTTVADGTNKLGDKTFDTWVVDLDDSGAVIAYAPSNS